MSTYSEYKNLELPTSPERYDVGVFNKNNMVIDSELHKLDLKNESQDNLLATKESLNSEILRATAQENKILEDMTNHNSSTSAHSDIRDLIQEVFTSVSDGKELIASAITDKGVETDATDTFVTMAQNISDIPTDGGGEYEFYEGVYNLIPKVSEQSVETKDKVMKDNVTVAEIPFHEVSNETGTTVVIGGII